MNAEGEEEELEDPNSAYVDALDQAVNALLEAVPRVRIKTTAIDGCKHKIAQQPRFDDNITVVHNHEPYSRIYGRHPAQIFCTGPVGTSTYEIASAHANPYTGKSQSIMQARLASRPSPSTAGREEILQRILRDGADWETPVAAAYDTITNTITKRKKMPKAFRRKRQGATAVKQEEALQSTGHILDDEQSKTFRALAARAN